MLCCIISCTASNKTNKASEQWVYIDNGIIRIGVDKSRGACIGFFGESKTGRNLLNHFDEGRFIQQSYYGTKDGSNWNGKPWVYNPVQGGSFNRTPSKLLKFDFDKKKNIVCKNNTPQLGRQRVMPGSDNGRNHFFEREYSQNIIQDDLFWYRPKQNQRSGNASSFC